MFDKDVTQKLLGDYLRHKEGNGFDGVTSIIRHTV
jgi:hypothetical protein